MPRLRKGACFFLVVSALGCRTPQGDQITENKDTSSSDDVPASGVSINEIEHMGASSGGSSPAGTAPTDGVKPAAVASHTPSPVGSVQVIPRPMLRGRLKPRAIVPSTLSASDLGLAKETVQRARLFERNLQGFWYPVKKRCARAITHRLIDAWGHPMDIDCQLKAGGLVIRSAGPDGVFFSSDDVQWIGNPRPML